MSHHEDDPNDADGAGGEAWILRLLMLTMVATLVAVIISSLSDIQRYLRMRQM
jgi:hypothetical protein